REEEEPGDPDGDRDEPAQAGADPAPPFRGQDRVDEVGAIFDEEPGEDAEEDDVDRERGGEILPERGAADEERDAAERVRKGAEERGHLHTRQERSWAVRIRT